MTSRRGEAQAMCEHGTGVRPYLRFTTFVALAMALLGACDVGEATLVQSNGDAGFWESFSVIQPDGSLSLELVDGEAPSGASALVNMVLVNMSQNDILFPPGNGARLFVLSQPDGSWIEIGNRAVYVGSGDTLAPSSDPPGNSVALITVAPDLEGIKLPASLRVIVVGDVVSGGTPTGQQASAYSDIVVSR